MPSSVIQGWDYDADARRLTIRFTSGRRYRYAAVPAAVARGLARAVSKGRYFNHRIRGRFAYRAEEERADEPAKDDRG